MKKLILSFVLSGIFLFGFAQKSCCSKPGVSSNGMAVFAKNEKFHTAHLSPEPFNYTAEKGEIISFATPDGKTGTAYAVNAASKSNNVIIMFHEWWGLNDYIKREADNLQKELGDAIVYAVDVFDGKLAASPQEAGALMGGLSPARGESIINGLISVIGVNAQVGTIGWCMGGSWSYNAAVLAGKRTKACVMYYGFPDTDEKKVKLLQSDILYIRATQDSFIKKENVDQFEKVLKSGGKKITIKAYDADHAFANPSNPKYSKTLADDAHAIALNYLKKRMGL